ncbi:MAG: ABC transporter substrate-binding protein [Spirochaetes bacterium]|nr:ABC transporter substrate-binding protein [Spirochaetota bacterium]
MKKVISCFTMIVMVCFFVFSGCSKKAPENVLKIGASFALNEPIMNLEQSKWLKLLARLVNENGGWEIGGKKYMIDMIIYDTQGDPVKAKNNLEKLVMEDGVKIILGDPTGSSGVTTSVTEPNKVLCLAVDVTNFSADPKIKYYYTPNGLFFARGLMYVMYSEFVNKGVKSYVSVKQDNEMGHWADGLCASTWDLVSKKKTKKLGSVYYAVDTTDYAPIATKIMSMNPDLIDCNFAGNLQLYVALYNAGYKGIILPSNMDKDLFDNIKKSCGKEFLEGWQYYSGDPRQFVKDKEILELVDEYIEEYGEFRSSGCVWLNYWFLLKDAVEHTQSTDVDVLKAYLDKMDHPFMTLSGWCQMFARPEANNLRTVSGKSSECVVVVKDGEEIPFRVVTVKDHYLASVLSYNLVDVYKKYWEKHGYPNFPKEPSFLKFSDLGIKGHD